MRYVERILRTGRSTEDNKSLDEERIAVKQVLKYDYRQDHIERNNEGRRHGRRRRAGYNGEVESHGYRCRL
jgi:hypothetical protein